MKIKATTIPEITATDCDDVTFKSTEELFELVQEEQPNLAFNLALLALRDTEAIPVIEGILLGYMYVRNALANAASLEGEQDLDAQR